MEDRGEEYVASKNREKCCKKKENPGILRLENASRSARFATTTGLLSPWQVEPSSPQPSIDRLSQSVTFALAEDNAAETLEKNDSDMQRISVAEGDDEDCDEEDYSISACAILQRRNSSRRQSKRKRRSSSPFGSEMDSAARRRSSAYTISSGDTVISMEDGGGGTQEQILEKLKLHKEVLSGIKQQPWPLRRKVKLVRQAKAYVRKHEGALQERLAQSHNTKDVIARVSLLIAKKWQYLKRELVNLQTWLVPWELRIKEIESHFGSAVASYFTFLRWLFWINLVVAATLTAFVAIPEVLTADVNLAGERKIMLKEESIKSKHLLTLWEFEGVLKYSPLFYGYYTNQDSQSGYRLPLAYFVTNLVVYTYSFVAILRKMAENSRMSKLTEKEDECAFSWKLFTGWDFMIGNPETAHNRIASIILGFKEALVEEAEKQKDHRNWKIILMRIFVNISVISLLALSAYAVVQVVARSTEGETEHDWWRKNEITIVMSLISYIFPIFFEILGIFENYHPRKQLRMQLARIMVLNLLNLYSLIFALFDRINDMEYELDHLKPENTSCTYIPISCAADLLNSPSVVALTSLSLVLMGNGTALRNATTTTLSSGGSEPRLPINDTYYDDFNATLEEYISNGDYPRLDYEYVGNLIVFSEKNSSDTGQTSLLYEDSTEWPNIRNYTEGTSSYNEDETMRNESFNDTTFLDYSVSTRIYIPRSTLSSVSTTFEDAENITGAVTNESTFPTKLTYPNVATEEDRFTKSIATDSAKAVVSLKNEESGVKCYEKVCPTPSPENLGPSGLPWNRLDANTRQKLRRLCWETTFGQELAKLTVMDLVLTIVSTLSVDFFRAVFVRFMNNFWCWDLEKQFPQYGDFKIAENILHLVYNQGMVWMGMFFSPGLTALNIVKLGILMYLRSWAVLTCNVPHEVVFRASRSNNFYFALLLTMLFLCVLPVGYAIVWVEPSWHCGPFSGYHRIYNLATKSVRDSLPRIIQRCLDYVASPGIVIPLIVLMTLIIYYMASLTGSLREANNDLKLQLRHERTEERRKLFKIVGKKQENNDTPFARWKKILPILPSNDSENRASTERQVRSSSGVGEIVKTVERKRSTTSEVGEMTDQEQDSLPHDPTLIDRPYKEEKKKGWKNGRRIAILGDSWESQSSECGVIPEIRIDEAMGKNAASTSRSMEKIVKLDIDNGDI